MYDRFKQLGKESLIYGLGGVVSKFIGFLLLPIYTRVFTPADYGIMDVIFTFTLLATIILTSGTETALSYYFFQLEAPAERRKTITTAGLYLVTVTGGVATAVWLGAGPIAHWVFGQPASAGLLRVAVLSVPFSALFTLHLNVLRLNRRPWTYMILAVAQLLCTISLNILLVVILRIGVVGVFWSTLIANGVFALVGLWVNRAFFGPAFDRARLAQILRYGLPLVIGGISAWAIQSLDRYFLLRFSTLDQVGLYAVGLRLASAVVLVTMAFRTAYAPFQFEMAKDPRAREIYSRSMRYFILGTSLVCVPLALFARPLLRLLTTEVYVEAYRVVALASYAAVAFGLYQILSVGLLVTKRTGRIGVAMAIGAVFHVGYLALLVPAWDMIGAALATLGTHVTVLILLYRWSQRAYAVPYELGRAFRTLAAAGGIIGLGHWLRPSNLLLDCLVALTLGLVFLGLVPALSLLDREERRWLGARLRELWKSGRNRGIDSGGGSG